jgi:hypothetical protein
VKLSRALIGPAVAAGVIAVVMTTALMVSVAPTLFVEPSASAADVGAGSIVEDFSYPGAASYTDIKLITGDGGILIVDCAAGRTSLEVWSFNRADAFCFEVKGKAGFLKVELPDTYGIRNYEDFAMTAKVTVDEATKNVAVPQNEWVGVGVGTGENEAVLLELRV